MEETVNLRLGLVYDTFRKTKNSAVQDKSVKQPLEKAERRKRRRELVALFVVLAAIVGLSNMAMRLVKLSSTLPFVNSIFFFGIVNLNLILLAVLVFLIFRNLSKVFFERRSRILGAKLKTKLIVAFLSLSIIPTILLFAISSLYINSTFDKWFSVKVGNTLEASLEITNAYYKNSQRSAQHFAERTREEIYSRLNLVDKGTKSQLPRELLREREKYALDAVEVYWHPLEQRVLVVSGEVDANVFPRLPIETVQSALDGQVIQLVQHVGTGDVIRAVVPLFESRHSKKIVGALAVSYHVPVSLVNKVDEISSTFADFRDVNPLKYPVKSTYFSILVLITLLIIFVAIWVGLYLARQWTVPLERLVYAAREVGKGNLDVEVRGEGSDEIAVMATSFNRMTADLKENRNRLEGARRYLEGILSSVSAGVISVSADFIVTTVNKSAASILGFERESMVNHRLDSFLSGPLDELLLAIHQVISGGGRETIFKYINIVSQESRPISLLATLTPLYDSEHKYLGLVIVLDDISHLVKAQREVAWREVARRIAHEIKNPLTPIKLSAQRLQKRYGSTLKPEEQSVFQECTDTIVRQVDELKDMVNEFSQFARFPTANPIPNDLNAAIREVVGLYQQAEQRQIDIEFGAAKDIPIFSFDREQIKRVMINLLDNAIAAMQTGSGDKILVTTQFRADNGLVIIQVADNGPGIPDEILPNLFEPYFSTKHEGTGLGLAIAKRIINDHDGYIRVASSKKAQGEFSTFFTIELPVHRSIESGVQHGT